MPGLNVGPASFVSFFGARPAIACTDFVRWSRAAPRPVGAERDAERWS
jgi:hypothetical protein